MAIELLVGEHKQVAALMFSVKDVPLIEKLIKRGINTWHPEPPKEFIDALAQIQEMIEQNPYE
jgi:hypothetical protein